MRLTLFRISKPQYARRKSFRPCFRSKYTEHYTETTKLQFPQERDVRFGIASYYIQSKPDRNPTSSTEQLRTLYINIIELPPTH
jgi:hypothetical protein